MTPEERLSEVNRRRFLAAGSAAALGASLLPGRDRLWAQDNVERTAAGRLADHIHPDVRIRRQVVPQDGNALGPWLEARRILCPLHEFLRDWAAAKGIAEDSERYEALAEGLWAEFRAEKVLRDGDVGRCLRYCVAAQEPLYEKIAAGLKRPRFQWPEQHLTDFTDEAMDTLNVPPELARLMQIRASIHLADGRHDAFVSLTTDMFSMAQLVADGEGDMIRFIMGVAVQALASQCVVAYACHPSARRAVLEKLAEVVSTKQITADALANAYRVEVVHYTARRLGLVPDGPNLEAIVDVLIDQHLKFYDDISLGFAVKPERVARVRSGMLALFDGHPAPWDAGDTLRLFSGNIARMIADFKTPWLKREQDPARKWLKQIEAWPEPLWYIRLDMLLLFSPDEEKKEEKVTDRQIAAARVALREVHNPIGKLLLRYLDSWGTTRRVFEIARLRTSAALVVIACRKYLDEKGHLPDNLSQLVTASLLNAVPTDPFSGRPLRYSRERRLIWSYGANETDDGGDFDFDSRFPNGEDIAWRLPLGVAGR